MLPSIHYTAVPPPSGQEKTVYGLQVAIADWLRAYLRYGRAETFSFLIGTPQEADDIRQIAQSAGVDAARLALLDRRFPEQNMGTLSTVFRAEPDTQNLLWQRQRHGSFAFCGLAHAISGVEAGEVLQDYCLSPSEPTDAIVCPSRAVQSAIRAFWDSYADYLAQRFGAVYQCPVQLPVIPLGIDIDKFEKRATPDKRAAQRKRLGIPGDDIVLLWVGRLSAAIKAHPLVMFRAAESAAQRTGRRVHLVMVGYFVPDDAQTSFKKMAADFCAKACVHFIAANDARFPDGLWAAGDIFLSLVDNMQESFGLTPIEAMAAGLPRVLSDWDGYRDSVTDGEDGFLIRTTMPPPGQGEALADQVACGREVYGGFLAKAALTVAVDAEQAADRLVALILDADLRARLADKARARVKSAYDWRHIIPAYEALWDDLVARRAAAPPVRPKGGPALPTLPDPYRMYAAYPTTALREDDRLVLALSIEETGRLWRHGVNVYANDTMAAPADIAALLGLLASTPGVKIARAMRAFPHADPARLWRTIAWLLKLGVIKIVVG